MLPTKDVVGCDKSRRAPKQAVTREFPNGETQSIYRLPWIQVIYLLNAWREVGELKYLSSRRQEIKRDSHSSDERNGMSPNHTSVWGCRTPTSGDYW